MVVVTVLIRPLISFRKSSRSCHLMARNPYSGQMYRCSARYPPRQRWLGANRAMVLLTPA